MPEITETELALAAHTASMSDTPHIVAMGRLAKQIKPAIASWWKIEEKRCTDPPDMLRAVIINCGHMLWVTMKSLSKDNNVDKEYVDLVLKILSIELQNTVKNIPEYTIVPDHD